MWKWRNEKWRNEKWRNVGTKWRSRLNGTFTLSNVMNIGKGILIADVRFEIWEVRLRFIMKELAKALLLPPIFSRNAVERKHKGERSAFAGWWGGGDAKIDCRSYILDCRFEIWEVSCEFWKGEIWDLRFLFKN